MADLNLFMIVSPRYRETEKRFDVLLVIACFVFLLGNLPIFYERAFFVWVCVILKFVVFRFF